MEWQVKLRSWVFDWVLKIWQEFTEALQSVFPEIGTCDHIIWSLSCIGRFKCGSFCRLIARVGLS